MIKSKGWLIALCASIVSFLWGLLLDRRMFPDADRDGLIVIAGVSAAAIAVFAGTVWSQVEGWMARPLPQRPATVRFSSRRPAKLAWAPGIASPRDVLALFEGRLLHRKLVGGAEDLIDRDDKHGNSNGLNFTVDGHHFQVVPQRMWTDDEFYPERWSLILRDPDRAGDVFTATTEDSPEIVSPSIVAAVVNYRKGRRNWEIDFEELYALSAASIAAALLAAWQMVANELDLPTIGVKTTARLDPGDVGFVGRLDVPTTAEIARLAQPRLAQLLGEFPVPVAVSAIGSVPDDDHA